jgi:predicted nucleic acid-binding protein
LSEAITDTSPLVYLHRAGGLKWLASLFTELRVPPAVLAELEEGRRLGFDVPDPDALPGFQVVEPGQVPSSWLALDLGPGELAAMACALANPSRILLLDDQLARRTAEAAGFQVWGTLRVVLEAKANGSVAAVSPVVDQLKARGMWISDGVRKRILDLAGE